MKRTVVFVLLVVMVGVVAGVTFPETGVVDEASPNGLANEVRIEVPYNENATATVVHDTAGNYTLILRTDDPSTKTVMVAESAVTPFAYTQDVLLYVDGEQTDYGTIQALSQNWTKFTVDGEQAQVTFIPAAAAGGGSFIGGLRFFFLEHSVTILLVALVGLAVISGMVALVLQDANQPSNIEWRRR